jgi:lipopolysaccharide transport system ATP-binding protein
MSDVVIRVEGLGKRYVIGHQAARHGSPDTLRDVISGTWKSLTRSARDMASGRQLVAGDEIEDFWALDDVSFEVKRGEVVGIIGRNGAGKSTLLKILSRITEPSAGRVEIRGRVASLLEVGTGFHPELTGRENVYLNGAILGMSRAEIKRKFDEIVSFAEVEKFLDTPVKRYSSGMYVRLAFAVAAHLDPEILIVDEVLAVGDVAFQNKCLNKMQDVAGVGRTVLFVSHNLQAVRTLCTRGILLSKGRVERDAPAHETIDAYKAGATRTGFDASSEVGNHHHRRGDGSARFTDIRILDAAGGESLRFPTGETVRMRLAFKVVAPIPRLHLSMVMYSGAPRVAVTSVYEPLCDEPMQAGEEGEIELDLPAVNLRPGEYNLYFWLGSSSARPYDVVDDVIGPLVITTDQPFETLGYDPASPGGYFDLASRTSWQRTAGQAREPAEASFRSNQSVR